MTSLIQLNEAQALIYSRSNIRRAFPAFDDTDIAGIFKQDDKIVVTRNDGSQRSYPADQVRTAFKTFTSRTPDFFSYLGPNYRGPSIWKNNCYILFKGWLYSKQGAESTFQVKAQHRWADRFAVLSHQSSSSSTPSTDSISVIFCLRTGASTPGRRLLVMMKIRTFQNLNPSVPVVRSNVSSEFYLSCSKRSQVINPSVSTSLTTNGSESTAPNAVLSSTTWQCSSAVHGLALHTACHWRRQG